MVYNVFMFIHCAFLVGISWGVPVFLWWFFYELIDILENNKRSS